ncbi:MAG: tetratricopeptide repeat protein [Desulfovibrionaceae bacterium]|nr:tetratricopeptide repeat protein [Desulfovibrionaceae bacterium]
MKTSPAHERGWSLASGQRLMVLLLGAAVLAMFAASFWYRMEHPTMRVEIRQERAGMEQAMDMGRIQELMARIKDNPEDVPALTDLGNTFMMMGAWDKALIFLQQARNLSPDDVSVLMGLAVCRFQKKEHQKAADLFARILVLSPNDGLAHYNLAIVLKHYLGRPGDAEAHFRAVLDSDQAGPEVKDNARRELGG